MIRNGIYSLIALAIDGEDVEVGGVLILLDGKMYGGDSLSITKEATSAPLESGKVK